MIARRKIERTDLFQLAHLYILLISHKCINSRRLITKYRVDKWSEKFEKGDCLTLLHSLNRFRLGRVFLLLNFLSLSLFKFLK